MKKKVEDSSKKILDIKEQKIQNLENEIKNLLTTNLYLQEQLNKKEEEVKHLQKLLEDCVPLLDEPHKLLLTEEEEISLLQLERLKAISLERQLTLDEVKMFDILVKNKRLAQKNPTLIADYKKLPENLTTQKLLSIATSDLEKKE